MKPIKKVIINGQEVDASQVMNGDGVLDPELVELIQLEQQHNQEIGQKNAPIKHFSINGQTIEGFSDLPPEVQQKLQNLQQIMPELLSGNPLEIFKNLGKLQKAGSAFLQLQNSDQLKSLINGQFKNSPQQPSSTISINPSQASTNSSPQTQQASLNAGISTTSAFDSKKPAEQPFRPTSTANHSSSYNPIYQSSKGDSWRKLIIFGVVIFLGYLAYEYFVNGKLPF
jgi:hypothetical protein